MLIVLISRANGPWYLRSATCSPKHHFPGALSVVCTHIEAFCILSGCNLIFAYRRFGGIFWIHLQAALEMEAVHYSEPSASTYILRTSSPVCFCLCCWTVLLNAHICSRKVTFYTGPCNILFSLKHTVLNTTEITLETFGILTVFPNFKVSHLTGLEWLCGNGVWKMDTQRKCSVFHCLINGSRWKQALRLWYTRILDPVILLARTLFEFVKWSIPWEQGTPREQLGPHAV
jgi:hypothetical protein